MYDATENLILMLIFRVHWSVIVNVQKAKMGFLIYLGAVFACYFLLGEVDARHLDQAVGEPGFFWRFSSGTDSLRHNWVAN